MSSFLIINDEKKLYLTGDDIVKHEMSAPLVILSACETMPNYGYVKLLSDAFMEAGAYCVTTTFLPIKVIDAATFIIVHYKYPLSSLKDLFKIISINALVIKYMK